ncbi:SMP-30/gluconolactonase/LRE family protein [Microbacterium oxydans]|uniref:SMP-30/gluconolactonase/LRE family protein n=1 Tax=Microbacterium sp. B19(2022) TaxID=2914045 RepID=UPI00142F83F9|nr:SMP-30/gluconolactonase/LRE family protein [Microbacterium sp. B19(2022)]NJI59462.1 SMP-30/gluconolactonase/LRE family protein [Microbacterium sp. B19(2022)]
MIDTVADGLDHPECVTVGPDGTIFAGGEAGQLYRLDGESFEVTEVGSSGGWLLGLAVDGHGNVVACDPQRRQLVRFDGDGAMTVLSSGTPERPMITPNFPVYGASGVLYVSDSGTWPAGGGCIYRVLPGGSTELWSSDVPHFTNGLALDQDEKHLYVVESTLPGITRIPILEDGSAGRPELVVSMPGTVPDGIAFDSEGRLYIGCYRPDRLYTLEPDGTLLILRDDFQGTDLAAPTNIVFSGADRRDLLVASLGRWHIARIRTEVPGAPLHHPTEV